MKQGLSHWLRSIVWHLMILITPAVAASNAPNPSELDEYRRLLDQTLERARTGAQSPMPAENDLISLAQAYLDAGDDLYTDPNQRRRAYQEAARTAQRALAISEQNAEAHFLYAANLGNAVRLGSDARAALELRTIKHHVTRAIELNPHHARALQFMGGLLAELPWFLGGRADEAERLLRRALEVDSGYTNARLLLAKLYLKQKRTEEARDQLVALLNTDNPHYPLHWRHQFKPEAERLLQSLGQQSR